MTEIEFKLPFSKGKPIIPINRAQTEIIETADEALYAKYSAVKLGYYNDSLIKYFLSTKKNRFSNKKYLPIINRGYYCRVSSLSKILTEFLCNNNNRTKVIYSLGAGFDSLLLNYLLFPNTIDTNRDRGRSRSSSGNVPPSANRSGSINATPPTNRSGSINATPNLCKFILIELDLPPITTRKAEVIQNTELISKNLSNLSSQSSSANKNAGTEIHSDYYHLIPIDLSDTNSLGNLITFTKNNFISNNNDVDCLILSECTLIYLEPKSSDNIISLFGNNFNSSVFVLYEQIKPNDGFGKMMVSNLLQRNIILRGIEQYPSLEKQVERFKKLNYPYVTALDMLDVYNYYLNQEDRKRVEKLEFMDEFEEWNLLQGHYCIIVATNNELYCNPISFFNINKKK